LLVHFHHRSGEVTQMVDHGLTILPLLRLQDRPAELIDLLRFVALGASDCQRFDVALVCAQEAQTRASDIADVGRLSLSVNALGCLFERLGDPWQAERLLRRALTLARAQAEGHPLLAALNNLAGCLLGKYYMLRDALPQSEAAEPLRAALAFAYETVAHPLFGATAFHRALTLGNLGEIQALLGAADLAQASLDEALALADQHAFIAQSCRIRYAQGELLLQQGRAAAAWSGLQALLSQGQTVAHPAVHMLLQHALWRCASALQMHAEAARHLEHYLHLERKRAVDQLRAQSELFITRAEGDHLQLEAERQQQRSRELEADALSDQLTGLSNRRELERRWPKLVEGAREAGTPLSVAMLDLDHFKEVNDRFGHAVGDRVLVLLAEQLRAHTRGSDLAVRTGGEEFLLVLPETTIAAATEVCERLRQRLATYDWEQIAAGLKVTISGGICSSSDVNFERLRERADEALYQAKREGRNRLVHAVA
ncbi:MAG: GGDEF domain-containing protein, partial [Pseudomonadota bacterium]|nr:GGDEF domain-containing protein [Pseudomonadota bacterium]